MNKILFQLILIIFGFIQITSAQPVTDVPGNQANLTGFDGIQWGTTYKEVKDRLRTLSSSPDVKEPVTIIADMPGREIRVSRKEIIYRYVFYSKPEIITAEEVKTNQASGNGDMTTPNDAPNLPEDQNRLFFVESTFSYVPAMDLEKKISEKYGSHNGGIVDKDSQRGFYIWSFQRGFLVQWVDPYKQKPFSRSLYYASKDIIEEIKADYGKFQYTREIKTLMDILY